MVASSRSANSTSSNTTYDTKTQNLNLQGLSGDGTTVAGSNNTVVDGGAIDAIKTVANTSVEKASDISIKSLDLSRFALSDALTTSERASRAAMQYVFDASQPATAQQKDITKTALYGAAIIAGAVMLTRMK